MRRARTWLPAWLGARLRARRFGPLLIAQAGLVDPLVADARRELAKLDAAAAEVTVDQVDVQRRRAFAGLVALGGAIVSTNPLPRRRRGAIARLIAALF